VIKLLVRGPALSRSGYGEQTRFAMKALREEEHKYDIYLENVGWGQTGVVAEDTDEKRWLESLVAKTAAYKQSGGKYDISLQVTIPNEWEKLAPINVGYTAGIEVDRISHVWIEKAKIMDRIIVISNHAKDTFNSTKYDMLDNDRNPIGTLENKTRIDVVNYPVRTCSPGAPLELDLEHDTNFLAVAQWCPRKNFENTVRWFLDEFRNDEVGLVLKTNIMNNCNIDKEHTRDRLRALLDSYKDRKCSVHLIHGDMSEQEMASLYTHPKISALITLTHGEGFGLPIFEAVCNELPVIAPDWSGQVDFLYGEVKERKKVRKKVVTKNKKKALFLPVSYKLAPVAPESVWDGVIEAGSHWCYADKTSYMGCLRKFTKNKKLYQSWAKKLKEYVFEHFSEEKLNTMMRESILLDHPGLANYNENVADTRIRVFN